MNVPLIGQLRLTHRQVSVFKSAQISTSDVQHKLRSVHQPSIGKTVLNSESSLRADLEIFRKVIALHSQSICPNLEPCDLEEIKVITGHLYRLQNVLREITDTEEQNEALILVNTYGPVWMSSVAEQFIKEMNTSSKTQSNP